MKSVLHALQMFISSTPTFPPKAQRGWQARQGGRDHRVDQQQGFFAKKFARYIYWVDLVFILTFSHSCLRVARAPRSETSRTSPTAQLWRSSTSSTSWSLGPSIMNLSRLGQVYLMRWVKLYQWKLDTSVILYFQTDIGDGYRFSDMFIFRRKW